MKLTGNLKKQVEKAETKDEKKSLIENAGMLLNDDELGRVAGGYRVNPRDGLFGVFSTNGIPRDVLAELQRKLARGDTPYQLWKEQHPNATDEEIIAYWESQQGN